LVNGSVNDTSEITEVLVGTKSVQLINGSFSTTINLTEDLTRIIVAIDKFGNIGRDSVNITLSPSAPPSPTLSPSPSPTPMPSPSPTLTPNDIPVQAEVYC